MPSKRDGCRERNDGTRTRASSPTDPSSRRRNSGVRHRTPGTLQVEQAYLNIDGAAGTTMPHFDGTAASIDFLKYDLVNLAYHLPNIEARRVIGVGGGRDVFAAHLFGVKAITGVELNRIFIDLHLRDPFYSSFSNLRAVPGLTLHVDDARSWFAATDRSFDLIR
jgi:hypothetical protein